MEDTSPKMTSNTSIIQSTNQPVPLLRAVLYESATGTNMPSAKHSLSTQPHALFTHAQSKKFKNPDTAIAIPIATTTQNENLLNENVVVCVVRVVLVVFVLFAIVSMSSLSFLYKSTKNTDRSPLIHRKRSPFPIGGMGWSTKVEILRGASLALNDK